MKYAALLMIGLAFSFFTTSAEAKMKALSAIGTKAGQVVFMEDEAFRYIVLDENIIYQGDRFMAVYRHFKGSSYDALILRDFSGPDYCPVQFVLIRFNRDETYWKSKPFGRCGDKPEVDQTKKKIVIHFEAFGSIPAVDWIYDGLEMKAVEPKKKTPKDKKK